MPDSTHPSGVRNFFGGVVNHLTPFHPYDNQTGQYNHLGASLGGAALRMGAGLVGGPAAGFAVGRLENAWGRHHYGNPQTQPGATDPSMQQPQVDPRQIPDTTQGVQASSQPSLNGSFLGGPHNMGGNQQPLSQYGPMAGAYQYAPQGPQGSGFQTGLPDHNMGYANLPNYGQAPSPNHFMGPQGNPALNAMAGRANSGGSVNPLAFGVGRGGAGVIQGDAARDYFAGMKQGELAPQRQMGADPRGFRVVQ